MKRLRLLPVLIVVAFIAFGAKVGGLWTEAERIIGISVPVAEAAEPSAAEEDPFADADEEEAVDSPAAEAGSDSADDDALLGTEEEPARPEDQAGGRSLQKLRWRSCRISPRGGNS